MNCGSDCGIIAIEILTGLPGLAGPAGPQGEQGIQGEQGPAGPSGTLGNVIGDVSQASEGQNVRLTVTGIQSRSVADTLPATSQILYYTGAQWEPTTLTAGTY